MDTTPRYKNDNQTGQFGNQRAVNVVGARETVGGPVVQQSGIQCFNCKEFGHYAKECRKPKRVKDSTYHKEKMLMCKQARKNDSFAFVHELKQEMHADLKYVKSLEDELDELESDKANFSNILYISSYSLLTLDCSKHMMGNPISAVQFIEEKYLGTVPIWQIKFAPILGYRDWFKEISHQEGVYLLRQGNDLLTGNHGTDLYTIYLQETSSLAPICLMAKASPTQAWLWHRRLSHLNFRTTSTLLSKQDVIYLTLFLLRSKDETPEVLNDFLTKIQRASSKPSNFCSPTDRGTEFLNKTLHAFFKEEGIEHQTSTP
ncbi:putative ribonuclease H-like domain-containing protein [Tanacetum coccineum]